MVKTASYFERKNALPQLKSGFFIIMAILAIFCRTPTLLITNRMGDFMIILRQ